MERVLRMVLHLVRNASDALALEAIRSEASLREVHVVLLQDAVLDPPPPGLAVSCCGPDARLRGVTPTCPPLEYAEIVRMVAEAETVVAW